MALRSPVATRDTGLEEIPDADSARLKARQLLCEILPAAEREQLLATDSFFQKGKRATYRICRGSQTELYRNGRLVAHACLQLTIPAPSYDRMIAEYLILNSDETVYWNKANILPVKSSSVSLTSILLVVIDLGLLLNLITDYLM